MARWPFNWMPRPGRFGNLLELASAVIGTGGTSVANSTTTQVILPTTRARQYVESLNLVALTAATSAGAVTVQVFRVTAAGVATALTAATSIRNDIITAAGSFALPITAADTVRTLNVGDYLRVDAVAAGTVTGQPVATVVAELGILQ